MPEKYGNWNSIYHKFRNWIKARVFEKIFQALVGNCKEYHLVEIDSTFCKVHQHAAGARKILGNQDIGISRGGKTTKIHALVNEDFQLLRVLLSGGQIHDSECALKLLEDLNIEDKSILGDKAYTTNKIRTFISEHKAKALSLTNQMRLSHTSLIKNFIKLAILSKDFLIASNTTDTLQHVTTNCPFAF